MQPKLKVRSSKAWSRAYSLVFAWLDEHAKETRTAIRTEFNKSPPGTKQPAADEEFESLTDKFDALLRVDIEDFRDQVAAYSASASMIPDRQSEGSIKDFNADSDDSIPSGTDRPAVDELNPEDSDAAADPFAPSFEPSGSLHLSFESD
jgi:hypothetical protein